MTLRIHEKKSLGNISKQINFELQHKFYSDNYSQFSIDLVSSIHYLFKLQCFILFRTLLRFSDAKNFPLRKAAVQGFASINTQKTKKDIIVPFEIFNSILKQNLEKLTFFSKLWDYVGVSTELKYRLQEAGFPFDFSGKSKTHVFRHIHASYLFSKEIPLDYIADVLGDSETITKNYYIHNSNKFFFLN